MPPLSVTSRCVVHEVDDRVRASRVELAGVGAGQAQHVAGVLDGHHLHAEAQAEARDVVLAGVAGGGDLALDAALAEAAGDDDAVEVAKPPVGEQPSTSSAWIQSISTLAPWGKPPCLSASTTDR